MFFPFNHPSRTKLPVSAPRWTFHRQTYVLKTLQPRCLNTWLWDSNSLTAKLLALSKGHFSVKVLRQIHDRAELHECQALGIKPHQICLIREVVLLGKGESWVFARSILPLASLTGRLRHLRHQGNRPLGAFLFSQPDLVRSPIATAALEPKQAYLPNHLQGNDRLWGRRSVFFVDQKPLLVSEVFLSALVNQLESDHRHSH